MAKKQLKIKILPSGEVEIEIMGVKGKKCLDYLGLVQEVAQLEITKQKLKPEFYEKITDENIENDYMNQNINNKN